MTAVNIQNPDSIAEAAKARQAALGSQGEHLSFAEAVQWVTTAARRRPRQAPDTVEIPVDTVEFAEASPGTGVDLSSADSIDRAAKAHVRHRAAMGEIITHRDAVQLVTTVEGMGRDKWIAAEALALIDAVEAAGGTPPSLRTAVERVTRTLGWR